MRAASVAWERAAEVRRAARGWRRVGAIDQATEETIRGAFPDPCLTLSPVWRVLTACVVTAVILGVVGAFALALRGQDRLAPLMFLCAGASIVVTEVLEASPRLARRGAAGATSFWGVAFLLAGVGLAVLDQSRFDAALDAVLIAGVVAWGVGGWRWGSPLFTGLSAISLFLFLGRLPYGRAVWILVGTTLAGMVARRLDEASWAPSHRRAAAVLVVAGILAAYGAVNVYSLDGYLLEGLGRFGRTRIVRSTGLRVLSALGTAVIPLLILMWGARSRRTFVLDTGIVLLALSLVTLRHYVHLAPLWAILTLAGGVLVALALGVERALRRAPGGEKAGYTGAPLFADERRQQVLQVVSAAVAFTSPAPATEEKGFAGGGGKFGGGGAEGRF